MMRLVPTVELDQRIGMAMYHMIPAKLCLCKSRIFLTKATTLLFCTKCSET